MCVPIACGYIAAQIKNLRYMQVIAPKQQSKNEAGVSCILDIP
jgi:hypothetical protein